MKAGLKGKDMSKTNKREIPETMGAVCAVVYIMAIICFIPFPFYKDIVEATSGGGNRDVVKEIHMVETGRFLHRFPHSKVRISIFKAIRGLSKGAFCGRGGCKSSCYHSPLQRLGDSLLHVLNPISFHNYNTPVLSVLVSRQVRMPSDVQV